MRIAESENMGKLAKAYKGRFVRTGIVTDKCGDDSYLIREEDGRFEKRRHYDLRKIAKEEENMMRIAVEGT